MESLNASSISSTPGTRRAFSGALTCLLLFSPGIAKADTLALSHSGRGTEIAWGHKNDKKIESVDTSANQVQTIQTAPQGQSPASTIGATTQTTPIIAVPLAPGAAPPAPVLNAPTSLVDLNSGRFGKLTVDLQNAQFHDTSIDHGSVTATDMDFSQGSLKALNIDVLGGHFQQFVFDEMTLNTAGDLKFDPHVLLQEKVLQFSTPARADVMVTVSQDSLNKFLADPHTLQNLSVTVSKRLGGLASLFGASVANLGVNLHEAHVVLNKGNKIVIAINADLGMGGVGVPLSFEVDAQLAVKDGWVDVSDTHLMTNGQEISPQLSEMLVKKINSLASWGHKSDDIQFDFTEIKVVPGKQFSVKGSALIKRLRLTRAREDASPAGAPPAAGMTPGIMPVVPPGTTPGAPSGITPANPLPGSGTPGMTVPLKTTPGASGQFLPPQN